MKNLSRHAFAGSVLLSLFSVGVLAAAATQGKDKQEKSDKPAIGANWEIYAGGGLYFLDRTTGDLWVYFHPGEVSLRPKPKHLGRIPAVGKELTD
jgi:hypothetical protein